MWKHAREVALLLIALAFGLGALVIIYGGPRP